MTSHALAASGQLLPGRHHFALLGICLALWMGSADRSARADGRLAITVVDRDTGKTIPCRMHLRNAAGRPRHPRKAPFWDDHFVFPGQVALDLPVGNYTFELERGPEYVVRGGHFRIDNFADDVKQIDMQRIVDMSDHGWYSGDLDVRRRPRDMELIMAAEDLHVAQVVTWGTDASQPGGTLPEPPVRRTDGDRFFHLMAGAPECAGGTLFCFHLPKPLLPPDATPEYPASIHYALEVHKQPDGWVDLGKPYAWDMPMLVALGQVDSIQVAHDHFRRTSMLCDEGEGRPRDKQRYPPPHGNARWSQDIYFKLLECGLRIPPSAGSGSGAAPNPVGYNRMYVHVGPKFDYAAWWENLRTGRVVVTNGPLMRPTVHGELPGHVFQAPEGETIELEIGLTLSTRQPISYLEIIQNGEVEHSVPLEQYAQTGRLPKLRFDRSGWFLVRVVTDLPKTYRFAMTGPYYVEIGSQRRVSKRAAEFFLDWVVQRARQLKLADPARHRQVLAFHRRAHDFWQQMVEQATAE